MAFVCSTCLASPPAQQTACAGYEAADLPLTASTFPVHKIGGAILFRAGMAVDADGAPNAYGPHNRGLDFTANAKNGGTFSSLARGPDGKPVIQRSGRFKGYYVSTTSLRQAGGNASAPATYVNAAKTPYFVLPPEFMQQFGVVLGDLAVVTNRRNGRSAFAIFADVGPPGRLGEGSIALAEALGLNASPRYGGTTDPSIIYLVFPGSGLGQGKLRTAKEIRSSASKLFRQWGSARRLQACSTPGSP